MQKKIIDTSGKDCPLPLIELKKIVAQSKKGQQIEVIFTCPEATNNLPRYAQEQGYSVLEFESLQSKGWRILIEL